MYFDYDWVTQYLSQAPSLSQAAEILNQTGLECEIESGGLEVEHTVNRPDAMCHFGIARELAVKTGGDLIDVEIDASPIPELVGWSITSANADHCHRYIGLKVDGVKSMPSPPWLSQRLESIGQTSHDLLVDLTNFLLWELGHPSHAFDAEYIRTRHIHVRMGQDGETLTTLDGRDHDVSGLLCITDNEKPIALGGVMGGENSEINRETTSLLLELACFDRVEVRKTGRATTIRSDAGHRFERGVDEENMMRVIRRFIALLKREMPEAQVVGIVDMNLRPFQRRSVALREARLVALRWLQHSFGLHGEIRLAKLRWPGVIASIVSLLAAVALWNGIPRKPNMKESWRRIGLRLITIAAAWLAALRFASWLSDSLPQPAREGNIVLGLLVAQSLVMGAAALLLGRRRGKLPQPDQTPRQQVPIGQRDAGDRKSSRKAMRSSYR